MTMTSWHLQHDRAPARIASPTPAITVGNARERA